MSYENVAGSELQSQKTIYKGVEYRSKLEAKTAQTLDNLGIAHEYESKVFQLSNGMWYKPDFWLPDASEFIECKGVMSDEDMAKIAGLVKDTGLPVMVISYGNSMLIAVDEKHPEKQFAICSGDEIALLECSVCGNKYFAGVCNERYFCLACKDCGNSDFEALECVEEIDNGQTFFKLGQKTAANDPFYSSMASIFNR